MYACAAMESPGAAVGSQTIPYPISCLNPGMESVEPLQWHPAVWHVGSENPVASHPESVGRLQQGAGHQDHVVGDVPAEDAPGVPAHVVQVLVAPHLCQNVAQGREHVLSATRHRDAEFPEAAKNGRLDCVQSVSSLGGANEVSYISRVLAVGPFYPWVSGDRVGFRSPPIRL
ncbi:hypothetical protein JCM30394_29890 [Deferrisoma palaeochoriense]